LELERCSDNVTELKMHLYVRMFKQCNIFHLSLICNTYKHADTLLRIYETKSRFIYYTVHPG